MLKPIKLVSAVAIRCTTIPGQLICPCQACLLWLQLSRNKFSRNLLPHLYNL